MGPRTMFYETEVENNSTYEFLGSMAKLDISKNASSKDIFILLKKETCIKISPNYLKEHWLLIVFNYALVSGFFALFLILAHNIELWLSNILPTIYYER